MSRLTIVAVVVLVVILLPVVVLVALSSHSQLQFDPQPKAIGESTPVKVKVTNPHGVRHVTAYVEQDGARTQVFDTSSPSSRVMFFGKHEPPREVAFNASVKKEGKARLIVETTSNDFRGATDTIAADVDAILRPPSVTADGIQHYINQGGSELVVFTPEGLWTEAGVRVGKYNFRSFPKPGSQNERFSLFGYPWDLTDDVTPVVYVRNPAGTEAQARFPYKLFPKKFRHRDLDLTDSFLEKVDNEIDPGGTGDLLTRFLRINGVLRRENNKTLADLRLKTEERFLWTGPFLQLANSKVESQFADVRSYIYKGKKVDEQVHLGFDLSVTQHVSVVAANDGKVVWAHRLGIYGNCIVVDHGYGLQSIYGHLSQIAVKEGDMVKKGQVMGHSGATGLAGGDHLHFSMQLDGVQINPVEWWDQHWIHDRVLSKINPERP
jgi:murein DD-endopeptidase MepM/ murein hydrolase activator NlpD